MNPSFFHNIGAFLKALVCGAFTATAAGTGDNTAVTGQTIDRSGYQSAKLVFGAVTTLTDAKALKLAVEYQTSVLGDGSDWQTAVPLLASTALVTSSGGTTEHPTWTYDIDLTGLPRYVRFNFTPDLTASNTDTASGALSVVLGGATTTPAA
jgi:hypothetical protein